jgi:hypothetical protein
MSSTNKKWGFTSENNKPLYGVFFCSRNKDNKDLENFSERRRSFLSTDISKAERDFEHFVEDGRDGEFCRMYVSVNTRDRIKTRQGVLHWLIDDANPNLEMIQAKICGIAMKHENAETKKWLFDFDSEDSVEISKFIADLSEYDVRYEVHMTPHGYAIITDHGFDTRELLKDRDYVTLKRDDMLCYKWKIKC